MDMSARAKQVKDWLQAGSINIFGLPFSGKDTQAERLGQALEAAVISGGDILRAYRDQDTIRKLMATGELFPSDFYLQTVIPYLAQPQFVNRPLVLSSIGRWKGEEQTVIHAAETSKHPIKAAVFLRISEEELWRRFDASQETQDRGPRYDDNKHAIETRLEEFKNKTLPVVEAYRQLGLLVEVNGEGDPADVTERILETLAKK